MKKLIALVAVVLFCITGWAGVTYFVGVKAESDYRRHIEEYAQFGPFKLSSRSYQRDFFSARAEMVLEMTIPTVATEPNDQAEAEKLQMIFRHDIIHGPLPFGVEQGFPSPALALIKTEIISLFGEEEVLEEILQRVPELKGAFVYTLVGFDGSAKSRMNIPSFDMQFDEGSFSFGGLQSTAEYARDTGSLVGRLEVPDMDLRFDDGSIQWQGINYDLDLVEVLPMLFVGNTNMKIGGMKMKVAKSVEGEHSSIDAKEVRAKSESSFADGMLHGKQTIVFDGIAVDGETFGPLGIDMDVKNLDGQALSDYQRNIWKIYGDLDQVTPEEMLAKAIPEYTNLAQRLMSGSPEFNINQIYAYTPMGEGRGTFKVKYVHPGTDTSLDLSSLQQYLPYISLDANLNIDKGLFKSFMQGPVKSQIQASMQAVREQGRDQHMEINEAELEAQVDQQIEMQLQMASTQGLIELEDQKISSRIAFSGGELLVNGKSLPIFDR